jgi:HAD superfamily hydrolase (TIGR01490 family)
MALALFDLDHTLLSGDSDSLWCEFLVRRGLLPPERLALNAEMDAGYRDGSVSVAAYCNFHVGSLGGESLAFWSRWREAFLAQVIRPRLPTDARALVERHRARGDQLVLTTASNRVITELTAAELGIPHLIATEVELEGGICSGRSTGTPNMRAGKVERLQAWLSGCGVAGDAQATMLAEARAYSDSANDLPLLGAVGHPVAVDPDSRLLAHAEALGWPVLRLRR